MRLLLICCLLVFNTLTVGAQQLFVQKYPRDVYQAAVQNWAMAQNKQGILYIANSDGLIQYDGVKWETIPTLNQYFVFSLAINAKNEIYVGCDGELGYFRKDSRAKYAYYSLTARLPQQFKNIRDIRQTLAFNDDIFFNDTRNIYQYKNGAFKVFSIQNKWLYKTKKQLFLVTGQGLLVYKNGRFSVADYNKDLSAINLKRIIDYTGGTYILQDEGNALWVYDPGAKTGQRLHILSKQLDFYTKKSPIRNITYLDNGMLAVTCTAALIIIDESGHIVSYNSKDMLGLNLATGFAFQDSNHNLWIGTNSVISQFITSAPLSYYDKLNGLDGIVLSLGKKGGDLYAGTDKGLFYKEKDSTFSKIPGLDNECWNFFNFNQKLYLAQAAGVFELQGKTATRLISHRYIQTLGQVKNRPDCLIMGTYDSGIWLLKKTGHTWQQKKIKGFEEETRFIQEDEEGNFWISHYNKGIFKIRLNSGMDSVTSSTFYDSKNGLPSNLNNRIYRLKNGEIIATTVNGIYSFNKIKNSFEPASAFRDIAGFCIYTLAETSRGDIYFWGAPAKNTETAGAFIKQPNGTFKLWAGPFSKIASHTNGLRVDVDAPILAAGENEMWIGDDEKIISYRSAQKTFYNQPFGVFIQQVHAADSLIFAGGQRLAANGIPFAQNNLKFSYTSSFYESPDKTEYQYSLVGFDNKWSGWNTDRQAEFTNLADGDYTFKVRAKNIYGHISQTSYFSFHIDAPWYKSWWCYLLYLISGCGVLYMAIAIYTNRIKKQKAELEEKVALKTLELSNKNKEVLEKNREILAQSKSLQELNLTKDKLFSIISHDLRGPIGQLKHILDLIASGDLSMIELEALVPELNESIGSAFSLTDNLLYWAKSQMEGIQVNPVWFDLMQIADENYHLFKPQADVKNITLVNQIKQSVQVYADKDMLMLVLRNLINNAVKFTGSHGTITIGSNIQPGYIQVFVKDTGTGLSAAEVQQILHKENFHKTGTSGEKGSGLGLMLCQDFIEKNNGELAVESELGKGSTFSFRLYQQRQKAI